MMKQIFLFIVVFSTLSINAGTISLKVTNPVKDSRYGLAIGSGIELNFEGQTKVSKYLFLGKMVLNHGLQEEVMVLDEKKGQVLFINAEDIKINKNLSIQTIVTPMDQATETCGAFALYNFWNQLREAQFKISQPLNETYSSERSRMQFLEEAISRYYISNQTNLNSIMKNYGKRFDYKCKDSSFTEVGAAKDFLFQKGLDSYPVIVEFWLENDMYEAPYIFKDFESKEEYDQRLWIPRKLGGRKASGHMIVVVASFKSNGKEKVLILDSNWQQPRIWDLDVVLDAKTAVKDLIFHDCK